MNILHFISSGGFFGAERVILELCKNMDSRKFHPSIAALEDQRTAHIEIIERAKEMKIPTYILPSKRRFDWHCVNELKAYMVENDIRLLHTHNYKSNLIGLLAARKAGIPVVATVHGYTQMDRKVGFYEAFDRFLLKFFNKIILVSNSMRQMAPFKKRVIIENGIDIKKLSVNRNVCAQLRKQFNIAADDIVVGTIGRLSFEKNQMLLLAALEKILPKFKNVKALIIGSGSEEEKLKTFVQKRRLDKNAILAGFMTNPLPFYGVIDIFVLPSRTEGIPLALLEAMAAQKPVIATRVGGVPDIIQDNINGLLIASEDISDLIRKIEYLIKNKRVAETLAHNGFELVRRKYSLEKMVGKYEQMYREIVNGK